jgi:hypothetical protein
LWVVFLGDFRKKGRLGSLKLLESIRKDVSKRAKESKEVIFQEQEFIMDCRQREEETRNLKVK